MKTLALLPKNGCLHCGSELKGRSDKKFCDYHCRNSYNNRRQSPDDCLFKSYVKLLKNNRIILKSLMQSYQPGQLFETSREALLRKGFSFDVITGYQPCAEGGRDAVFRIAEFSYQLRSFKVVVMREGIHDATAA